MSDETKPTFDDRLAEFEETFVLLSSAIGGWAGNNESDIPALKGRLSFLLQGMYDRHNQRIVMAKLKERDGPMFRNGDPITEQNITEPGPASVIPAKADLEGWCDTCGSKTFNGVCKICNG